MLRKKIILFTLLSVCFIEFAEGSKIKGVNNPEVLSILNSQFKSSKKYNSESIANKFRIENETKSIKIILHSFGYFDSEIKPVIEKNDVTYYIKLNERYKFNDVLVTYIDNKNYRSGLKIGQAFELINIDFDSYTDTKQLADGCSKIKDFLEERGFAFVVVNEPNLTIDKKKKKIKAIYEITLNGKTIIDKTVINIKCKKDPELLKPFVKNRIPWKDGDVYNIQKINILKDDLINYGIFSGIDISLSDPTPDSKDPKISHTVLTVNLEEALLRDVAAGVKYGTSEKAGVLFSWTHYNVDGKGSKFSAILDASKNTKIAKLKYSIYDIFYKKQELANQVFHAKEDVAAYDVTKIGAESILWQTIGARNKLKVGLGACYERSKTKDKIEPEDKRIKFNAFGIPLGINFDTTDSFLDPQKGIRCSGMMTPYFGNLKNITILTGKASIYVPIKKNAFKNSVVLAFYSKIGSIVRKTENVVPRDKLFFSGGANSVRGYGYQKIGEINSNKKPLGGESMFELGIEPRFRVSDNVGLAVFFEGGNVYSSNMPKLMKKIMWGYGLGMRYYTPLGPLRLDLAFPTKRRKVDGKKVDSMFNVYISVGQAF